MVKTLESSSMKNVLPLSWALSYCFWLVIVVQSLSCVWLFADPWTAARPAPLSFAVSQTLLKFMLIDSVMPSNHFMCRPLLPSIFPSIRVFSDESALCIRWPKYWSFSFKISPSNEYSVLISFRVKFDLPAIQGSLKNLLQHHNTKASILWCTAFFMVHDYWKNHSFDYTDLCQLEKGTATHSIILAWRIPWIV